MICFCRRVDMENMADMVGVANFKEFTKDTKKRGGKYCVALGPHNTSCKNASYTSGISMHIFPKNQDLRSAWTQFVQKYRPEFTPSRTSTLCSDHFEGTSFERNFHLNLGEFLPPKMKRCLKRDAVPATQYEDTYTVCLTPKRRKIRVRDLNPHLTCMLCKGYLVNPVTITECIHTFCKSCLVRHISLINKCPSCGIVIHETQPLYHIRLDRTMQDIINKILPRIEPDEQRRERKFYKTKGLPYPLPSPRVSSPSIPKESKPPRVRTPIISRKQVDPEVKWSAVKRLHHSNDQISLHLEYCRQRDANFDVISHDIQVLPKNFIRCSTHVTVGLLQRFIATKLNLESETSVGITCNDAKMEKDFTLKYISENLIEAKERIHPLRLQYMTIESAYGL